MSSLITKISKTRSTTSPKSPVRKAKKNKAISLKKKPGAAGSVAKGKKRAIALPPRNAKSAAKAKPARKAKTASAKKSAPRKMLVRKAVAPARGVPKPKSRKALVKHSRSSKHTPPAKALEREEKKVMSPSAMQAVKAFERALAEFNRNDLAAAKSSFEALMENFPDLIDITAPARTYLAICDQRLVRIPPTPRNNADALYNQGVFEFNRGNLQGAVETFQKALKIAPNADHILYSLAAAHARGLDSSKALEALRRAIRINPIHRSHARHDPDFISLRGNREFQLMSGIAIAFSD
jgi:tetratricopeptide (TPR) repeat protein